MSAPAAESTRGTGALRRKARKLLRGDRPAWPGEPARWGPNTAHTNEAARNRAAYRQLAAALEYAAGRYARGRLVDIGCGRKPWQGVFAPHVDEYIGVDHAETLHGLEGIDVIAGAYDVPLADGTADTVLLMEVLEHLESPARALAEVRRLLGPGGHLILTTPFSWPLHEEPRDFFRYSPYGLRHLCREADLDVLEIHPLSGIWTTLALQFSWALQRHRFRAPRLVDALCAGGQRLAWEWDRRDRQETMSWNHLLVARRPDAPPAPRTA